MATNGCNAGNGIIWNMMGIDVAAEMTGNDEIILAKTLRDTHII